MNALHRLVLVVLATATVGGCQLVDAAFGRVCEVDDDCRGDPRDGDLTCRSGRCLTPEVIDVVSTGERCDDAIPLEVGVPVQGTTATAQNDHADLCAGEEAPDRVYVVTLQARANLIVTLDVDGFDGALYASESADCRTESLRPASCTDDFDDNLATEVMRLDGVGPGDVYIVVDGARPVLSPVAGAYTLDVQLDVTCDSGFAEVQDRCIGIVGEVNATVARTNAAATLLSDGRVLLTGGRTGNDLLPTTSAEIYDPATNAFTATAPMTTSRARHALVTVASGEAVVMGGVTDDGGSQVATAKVEVFDPVSETWSAGPDLPRPRDLFTATALRSGEVLVTGGRDGTATLNDTWRLDPARSGWSRGPLLTTPRFGHVAVPIDDGGDDDVFLIGGRVGADSEAIDAVSVVETSGVDDLAPLGQTRGGLVAVALESGGILAAGGFSGALGGDITSSFRCETFNRGEDAWTDTVGLLSTPRLFATAHLLRGVGVVLAGGGLDAPTASVELYVESTRDFVPLPPLRHARLAHTSVQLRDGRILLMGGDGGDENNTVPLAAAELIGIAP